MPVSPSPDESSVTLAWSRRADWIAAFAVLAFWLMTRPYRGVRHDAILYAGQVLARLLPDRVGQDLFFAYGSQDKYSVFSWLVAPLFERLGIGPTEMLLLVACQAAFAFGCWYLMSPWLSRPLRWMALVAVIVLPHTYGGLGAVSYAEPFLTARSLAEPLSLFALASLLRGRVPAAIALAVLAMIFHPLIILPVLVVGWFMLVARQRNRLWLGLLLSLPVLAGGLGLRPFDGLFQRFDPAWLAAIRKPNSLVFAGSYGILDWAALAFDLLVLAASIAAGVAGATFSRLAKAALAASALFSAGWVLGADVFHNVLLTQLQLWRVYWVMHLLAMMAVPLLGLHYWRRGWTGRWCCAALGLAGVAVVSNWPTGWLCLAWALAALAAERTGARLSRPILVLAFAGSIVTTIGISAKVTRVTLLATDLFPDRFRHVGPAMVMLGLPFVAGLLSFVVMWIAPRGRRGAAVATVMAAVVMGFGAFVWDQRSPWQRRLEAGPDAGAPPFDAAMPVAASVYWDDDLITPWLLARRANFHSQYQGAGLLFNRRTALEFARRADTMAPLGLQRELCSTLSTLAGGMSCSFTREALADVCRGDPHPDYLVFDSPAESVSAVAEWHAGDAERHAYYLYSCAALR